MGFLSNLFKKNSTNNQSNQMQGFYMVRHEYGEAKARDLFQRANAGDVNAQLTIAKCFEEYGENRDAVMWYEKAAEAGSSKAMHVLTYYYEGRYVGVKADPIKAEAIRNKALAQNNPQTYLKMGTQYHSGDGVEKNLKKAFQYYMKAAELGNEEAKALVGLCYLKGEGIGQSNEQAFMWLSRSKDGFYGYYNLAQCYLKGIGTAKNMEQATMCLEKAVSCKCLDLYKAREQLADLYKKGYGGKNRDAKLRRLRAEMSESDRLLGELANLKL